MRAAKASDKASIRRLPIVIAPPDERDSIVMCVFSGQLVRDDSDFMQPSDPFDDETVWALTAKPRELREADRVSVRTTYFRRLSLLLEGKQRNSLKRSGKAHDRL